MLKSKLFINKLKACGLDLEQRTKAKPFYSSCGKILSGVSHGIVQSQFLFNIFMCDVFFLDEKYIITDYPDANILIMFRDKTKHVIKALQEIGEALIKRSPNNQIKYI